jgi:outer membrane protein OmpA-like peptidoglycan-associated protein
VLAAAALLWGCAQPAPPPPAPSKADNSYIALLPDADGRVGRATFTALDGRKTELQAAHTATRLQSGAPVEALPDASLQRDVGAALAAAPKPPRSFLLYFASGGARLTPESEALLPQIRQEIADRRAPDLSVIGHTDTAGDATANERLGLERARSIAQALMGPAPDATRPVAIESHGEANLLVPTPDNTPEARNRRVEVTVR